MDTIKWPVAEGKSMKADINGMTIHLIQGDLLPQVADALVVMTDPNLTLSPELRLLTGVDVEIQTKHIGWADIGTAVITEAGNLINTSRLIHAVVPRWGEGAERGKLGNLVWECLCLAEDNQLRSIGMPAMATGIWGYPVESCAVIMLERMIDYTFEHPSILQDIMICLSAESELDAFRIVLERLVHDLQGDDD
jgi:O-acetyl-ADP-ribose deacetylase (regulator of RNase III)